MLRSLSMTALSCMARFNTNMSEGPCAQFAPARGTVLGDSEPAAHEFHRNERRLRRALADDGT
jgi:hypothetical protein